MNPGLDQLRIPVDISWEMFLVAGSVAVGIALCPVSFQARRAAVANPVKSLRTG
jgi:putative ABC transport system permease protein